MSKRNARSILALTLAAAALGLALVGCADRGADQADSSTSETQTAPNGDVFNAADVRFATEMIPHHAQAIQMVVLAEGRPLDPEVADLAAAIRDAQVPEVESMTTWLTDWGQEIPETSLDHGNAGHDMETGEMPGMMSQDQMNSLAGASDAEFQKLWLEMMIEHHLGAVTMAQAEQADGVFEDAISLAGAIENAQLAEIAVMEGLLTYTP